MVGQVLQRLPGPLRVVLRVLQLVLVGLVRLAMLPQVPQRASLVLLPHRRRALRIHRPPVSS